MVNKKMKQMYEEGLLGRMYDAAKGIACVTVAIGSLLMPGCGEKPEPKQNVPGFVKRDEDKRDHYNPHVWLTFDPVKEEYVFGKYRCDQFAVNDVKSWVGKELEKRNKRMEDLTKEEREDLLNTVGSKLDADGDGVVRDLEYDPRNGFRYDPKTDSFSIGKYKLELGGTYEPVDFVVKRELKRRKVESVDDLPEEERTGFLNAIGKEMDKNGDFVISFDEAHEYVKPLWEVKSKIYWLAHDLSNSPVSNFPTPESAVEFIVKGADKDKDGEVTAEEFDNWVKSQKWINDAYERSRQNQDVNENKKKSTPHDLVNLVLKCSDKYNLATWPLIVQTENEEGKRVSKMAMVYPVNCSRVDLEKEVGDEKLKLFEVVYKDLDGDEKPSDGDSVEYSFEITGPDGKVKFSKFIDVIKADGEYLPLGEFDHGTGKLLDGASVSLKSYRNVAIALLSELLEKGE
jgi:hypothetical protein